MKRLLPILLFLGLCFECVSAPPPPLLYTFYTTNTTFKVSQWVTNIATNMAVIWGGGGGLSQAQVVALITNATVMQATNSQYAMLSTNVVTGIAITNPVLWASGIGSDIVSGDSPYGSGRFHIDASGNYYSSFGAMRIGQLSYFTNGISLPGGGLTISSTAGGITNLGSYIQPYTPSVKFFVGNDASFGSTLYANQISATNDITVTAGGINLSSITGGITNLGSYLQIYTPGAVFFIGSDAQFQGEIYGSNGMRVAGSTANTNWLVVDAAGEHATNTSGQHIDLQNGQLTVSGNVGIGTNPTGPAILEIANNIQTNAYFLRGTNTGTGKGFGITSNGAAAFSGPVTATTVTSAGEVTAGTNLKLATGSTIYWYSGCEILCSTNGVIKPMEYIGYLPTDTSHGASIQFNTVTALPFPNAAHGFTNKVWLIGNTNGCLTFMTSTNGTNRLDMHGINSSNVWVSTQMEPNQPLACFGALMMNSTNLNSFGAAYTNVTGFDNVATNQFTAAASNGFLTNRIPGYYRATVNASFIGINNGAYEGCLLTNGVDAEIISWKKTFDAAARMDCMSAHGIIYLPANTACSFGIKEATGAGSVAIHRASIVLGTP